MNIDMTTFPDSWEKVQCNDGSIEDVIFIEGKRYQTYEQAYDYIRDQFLASELTPVHAGMLAADYLSLISRFNQRLN